MGLFSSILGIIGAAVGIALVLMTPGANLMFLGLIGTTIAGGVVAGGIAYAAGYVLEAFYDVLTMDLTAGSSTYGSGTPVYTVEEGKPIARCYGRCLIAGNIIRSNDPGEATLKVIVGHSQGEIESILSWKINNIEWDALIGVKWYNEAVAATGVLYMDSAASLGETFVVGTQTFTWVSSRSGVGEVTSSSVVATDCANAKTAINLDLATVIATSSAISFTVTAVTPGSAGNGIAFTEDMNDSIIAGHASLGYVTLMGGGDEGHDSTHYKNTLVGTRTQAPIKVDGEDLFSVEPCAYRGVAHTGFKLTKNSQVGGFGSVLVEGLFHKCEPIGGGTAVFSRNPAVILWDWYRNVEGYAAAELDENAFLSLEELCAFYPTTGQGGQIRPPGPNSTSVKATSYWEGWQYAPFYSFDANKAINGSQQFTQWVSGSGQLTEQRLNVDLGVPVVLTKITMVNCHVDGATTNRGINNFSIQGSNTASDLDYVTYADGASGWTDVQTGLTATQYDDADPYKDYGVATPATAYRYYSIKIADSFAGAADWIGVRDICFWGRSPRYTFDYNFDADMSINDAKKLLWSSFNGRVIRSQGKLKPVWDWYQVEDESGSLTDKTSKYAFTMDNIAKDSFTWFKPDRPNVVTIQYLESSYNFKKSTVTEKDDSDIELRGEIPFTETCYFITQRDVASRRCKRKMYRSLYADYRCKLTAFSSAQKLEVLDLVTVTHTLTDWTAKQFIVIQKAEDEQGRPTFLLEAYYEGVYDDHEVATGGGGGGGGGNPYDSPPHSTGFSLSLVTGATAYSYDAVKVEFTPPSYSYYQYTEIYASNDDTNYIQVGVSSGEDFILNGLGSVYDMNDTCYIKTINVSTADVPEDMPTTADASIVIDGVVRFATWYAGEYDLWGGNASIDHADTKVVLGNLDGIAKIALGPSANAITYAGTETGFIVEGTGDFRAGGVQSLKWDVTGSVLTIGEWIVSPSGLADNFTEANATIFLDKVNARIQLGTSASAITHLGTESGFYVDGVGNVRFGGAESLRWTVGTSTLMIGEWIVSPHGIADNWNEALANIFLDNTNTLIRVGPTANPYLIIDGAALNIRSSNYVSGIFGSGFSIDPDWLEVGNAHIRGILRTAVFQKDVVSAVGGNLVILPADVMEADMTALDNDIF